MIDSLTGLVFIIGLTALIAVGSAFILRILNPDSSVRKRTAISGLIAGVVPMLLPIVALVIANGLEFVGLIGLLALLILAGLLAGLVGFPVAHFYNKRYDKTIDPDTFE